MATPTERPPHDLSVLVTGDRAAVEAVYRWINAIDAGVRCLARALLPALQAGNLDLPARGVIVGLVAHEAEQMGTVLRDRRHLRAAVAPGVWERVEIVLETAASACDTLRSAPHLSMDASAMNPLIGAITCYTAELTQLVRLLACAQVQRGDVGLDAKPTTPGGTRRQTGRPRGETDKEALVLAAIVRHHRWQQDGSTGEENAATVAQLASLASNRRTTVSTATVSRFLRKKFPGRGHQGYRESCLRGDIGLRLSLWQGEIPQHRFSRLLPHESGRDDD